MVRGADGDGGLDFGAGSLLEICFWREGFEAAFGPEQRGRKGVDHRMVWLFYIMWTTGIKMWLLAIPLLDRVGHYSSWQSKKSVLKSFIFLCP